MIKIVKELFMEMQVRKKKTSLEEGIDLMTIPWVEKDN